MKNPGIFLFVIESKINEIIDKINETDSAIDV
jgi:hypothetical protein